MSFKEKALYFVPAKRAKSLEEFADQVNERRLPIVRVRQYDAAFNTGASFAGVAGLPLNQDTPAFTIRTVFTTKGGGRRVRYAEQKKNITHEEKDQTTIETGATLIETILDLKSRLDPRITLQTRQVQDSVKHTWTDAFPKDTHA